MALLAWLRSQEPIDVTTNPSRAFSSVSFLREAYSLRSWLTTLDHKRIALLYMISITAFFFLGGAAATLIRLELADSRGRRGDRRDLQQSCSRCMAPSWCGSF